MNAWCDVGRTEGRFNRIASADALPVFRWEVVERHQFVMVLVQAEGRLRIFRVVGFEDSPLNQHKPIYKLRILSLLTTLIMHIPIFTRPDGEASLDVVLAGLRGYLQICLYLGGCSQVPVNIDWPLHDPVDHYF